MKREIPSVLVFLRRAGTIPVQPLSPYFLFSEGFTHASPFQHLNILPFSLDTFLCILSHGAKISKSLHFGGSNRNPQRSRVQLEAVNRRKGKKHGGTLKLRCVYVALEYQRWCDMGQLIHLHRFWDVSGFSTARSGVRSSKAYFASFLYFANWVSVTQTKQGQINLSPSDGLAS